MHWPPLLPGDTPRTHFCYRVSWPVGHSVAGWTKSMKNLRTRPRSEPATCWLVARCLKQLCQHIPQIPGNYLFTIYLKIPTVTHVTEHCMIGWQCIMNCKKVCIQSIMPHSQYQVLCLCLEELRDGKKEKSRSGWMVSGSKLNLRPPGTEAEVLYIFNQNMCSQETWH